MFFLDIFGRIGYTISGDTVSLSVALIWFGALEAVNSVGGISVFISGDIFEQRNVFTVDIFGGSGYTVIGIQVETVQRQL